MQTSTVLFIILAALVALGLVLFQYFYKSKKRGNRTIILSFLRFTSLFGIGLLLINPKFVKNEYTLEKANLVVLSDNSTSVANSKGELKTAFDLITSDAEITKKFNVDQYLFGNMLKSKDTFSFEETNTNISSALKELNEIYKGSTTAILMLSDGNQNLGEDYQLYAERSKLPVFPIAVGDTVQYEDLRIDNVNTNKFAFLKNKYPIEIDLSYFGEAAISSTLSISINGKRVFRENVKLSKTNNAKTIKTLLNANSVGVKKLEVLLSPTSNERNKRNNIRNLAIEIIDEKTNITIVTAIMHPDIGALKKSIESNEQRSVSIKKPNAKLSEFEKTDVFILYQPNTSFKPIYDFIQRKKSNYFTILGKKINRNFLNKTQKTFVLTGDYPVQETFGVLNSSFTKFDISDFNVSDFPPLENGSGLIELASGEALMQMKVLGKTFDTPLLAAIDNQERKELVLFGENLWKWRVQSYRNQQSFDNFDNFMGKLLRYLSSNKKKNRLNVIYDAVYEGSNFAKVRASYFDEAFVFDSNAALILKVKNVENGGLKEVPMLLKNGYYEADLRELPSAEYNFTVIETREKRSKSGNFTILDFDIEKQFSSTNYKKLEQLASATNGKLYFSNSVEELILNLQDDKQYLPTQKGTKNVVSLIDFRILLALIVATLALEWLIRKYNGLT